jgi:signal peptidase I
VITTEAAPVVQPAVRRRPTAGTAALVVTVLAALLVVFGSEPFTVRSDSMTPTLRAGDQLLAEKVSPRLHRFARGDVVVLEPPGSQDALMVKRVVALAGDRVGLADGRLVVNGTRVQEAYVDLATVDGVYFGPVVVPSGALFVMGDNRAVSVDSRDFGAVPEDRVVGRMVLKLW